METNVSRPIFEIFITPLPVLSATPMRLIRFRLYQPRAFAPQQFYQIVNVAALGQEAVDVDAQRAPPVQDGRREPRASAPLDSLLQSSLQLVLFCRRLLPRPHRQKADAAQSRLDLADALELAQLVEARGQILHESDLPLDDFGVAAHAHGLERRPDLQRHRASRAELSVAEEVEFHVRAAALFTSIFGRDVESRSQHRAAVAHGRSAAHE